MKSSGGKHMQGGTAYIPQELLKELTKVHNRLVIGIPCERMEGEKRLALTPEAVELLTNAGHHIMVETGAGLGINYADNHYAECGAEIVESPTEIYQADVILKILPPQPGEVALMKSRSTLFSMMQLHQFPRESYESLIYKKITALAYELLTDKDGRYPVMNTINEIEGTAAITISSCLLSSMQGGKGILLGGIPGVPPTEVVILGAGTAGMVAARAALGMGAVVKVFDEDINKLRDLQKTLGQTLFTSNFHPKVLHNAFLTADVVIGAMGDTSSRRRYVVAEELIQIMKRGALVFDLQSHQGGSFETTCGLPSSVPHVFEKYGILHYCKPSISNYVARTTAMAFSNIFVSMLISLGDLGTVQNMIKLDTGFRRGVYMYCGKPVNNRVSSHFNIMSNNLDIYLSAF